MILKDSLTLSEVFRGLLEFNYGVEAKYVKAEDVIGESTAEICEKLWEVEKAKLSLIDPGLD